MNDINIAVRVLNEAFAADPAAIHALCVNRVPCNTALADHPTVQVARNPVLTEEGYMVGLIGILNGVLEPMTGQRVAMLWEPPLVLGEGGRLSGFEAYKVESAAGQPSALEQRVDEVQKLIGKDTID